MSKTIIQIEHLNKTFGTGPTAVHALEDINLDIHEGEIFGIIGLSGAGKSTLVRCINLLERPDCGEVLFHGKNLMTMSEKELRQERRNISMIFQSFNLLDQRTALDNICFPLELAGKSRKEARKRAMELLELVGLPDKAKAYPAQLSGGQQQRVAIARALATNPKVLLCDEATSALDPNTTHSILSLIRDINKKLGITVVIITHQMSVVEEVCTHVAILDRGEVAEVGTVGEVFSSPKSAAGRRLVFPNGEDDMVSDPTKEKRLRIVFNGAETAGAPLITPMAIETGIAVNILAASIRSIESRAYGSMLLGIPGKRENLFTVTDYLSAVEGVFIEEV